VHDEGLDAPPMQAVYFPLVPKQGVPFEGVPTYMNLVVRAPTLGVPELTAIVQRLVSEIDPQVPIANPRSMDDVVGRSMAKRTFTLMLLAIAATMALVLSAVGLYGVISYVVGHRRGEIGIRMALGARASQVALMVVRQSLGLVSLGIVLGLAGAIATTRVLRALLFEVSPTDPLVLVLVSALLLILAAAASFAPTRQAARTSPLEALRAD
jgi:ABC-type antimicrobial peptide transport system permease subunit